MAPFKNFISKNKRGLTFVLFFLISLILLFYSSKSEKVTLSKVTFSVISPFENFFYSIGNFFQNTLNSISQLKKIQDELDRNKKELEQYKKIIIDFNVINNENNSLKKLLELKQSVAYDSIAAEIIGRDPQKLFDVLIINKGSNDGIKENMPVISYASGKKVLVGKIAEVSPFASKILTLNNSNFAAGCVIIRNRVHCIIQGENLKPGIVKLQYIPKEYVISEQGDDYVYTSGDSLLFPQGIEIGKITKLQPSPKYEVFNEALVQISIDLAKLEYVLILKVDHEKDNFMLMENPN
jgi:rod shape-determining protein MreC